jgi:hypothetical protein
VLSVNELGLSACRRLADAIIALAGAGFAKEFYITRSSPHRGDTFGGSTP